MSSDIVTGAISALGVVLAAFFSYRGIVWVKEKYFPLDQAKTISDVQLNNGGLVEKYQKIASLTADENLELALQKKKREEEFNVEKADFNMVITQLKCQLDGLKTEMEKQKLESVARFEQNEKENAAKFAELQKENEKWKNWAIRLAMQVKSLGEDPVPFDLDKAKRQITENVGGITLDYDPHNQE
jgi:hypothetical protein